MKQETADNVTRGAVAIVGAGTTWSLQHISTVVAICVGVATLCYVIVQAAFLIRKWYILEKTNWKTRHTDHGGLGD